jgi:hypothetical protein
MLKSKKKRISARRFTMMNQQENAKNLNNSNRRQLSKERPLCHRKKSENIIMRSRLSMTGNFNNHQTKTKFFTKSSKEMLNQMKIMSKKEVKTTTNSTYNYLKQLDFKGNKNSSKTGKIRVIIPNKKKTAKDFLFEKIFNEDTTQKEVFENFENMLIENSINGVRLINLA